MLFLIIIIIITVTYVIIHKVIIKYLYCLNSLKKVEFIVIILDILVKNTAKKGLLTIFLLTHVEQIASYTY